MKKLLPLFATAILLCALALVSIWTPIVPVSGAPMAAPTPVAAVDRGSVEPTLFNLWAAKAIAADTTTPCVEVTRYDVADVYYSIDHGTVNTTTLTLKFGNSETALVDGINVVATSVADASAIQQVQTFGKYMCIYANVSTTDTITITVNMLAK